MRWDIEALTREFEHTQPIHETKFFLDQLRDVVRQVNALAEFFECEHDYRWSVGAEVEPRFKALQEARRIVVNTCDFKRGVREPRGGGK